MRSYSDFRIANRRSSKRISCNHSTVNLKSTFCGVRFAMARNTVSERLSNNERVTLSDHVQEHKTKVKILCYEK